MRIKLISEKKNSEYLELLAERWQLRYDNKSPFALVWTGNTLFLSKEDEPKLGPIYVDWAKGKAAHRRKFGGGRRQSIAKAVGLNKTRNTLILDATAGMGRDAFVLASLGSRVVMVERNPVVAALLDDGLRRARQDIGIGHWVGERIELLHASSQDIFYSFSRQEKAARPDVVYMDPMYPGKDKPSALVKKEMRVFQDLVGKDKDADTLLNSAVALAKKRVVVKRSHRSRYLANQPPRMSLHMKKSRFDIYY